MLDFVLENDKVTGVEVEGKAKKHVNDEIIIIIAAEERLLVIQKLNRIYYSW